MGVSVLGAGWGRGDADASGKDPLPQTTSFKLSRSLEALGFYLVTSVLIIKILNPPVN